MKKIIFAFAAFGLILFASCTSGTADKSYRLAAEGNFTKTLAHKGPKADLIVATSDALSASKYNLTTEGSAIRGTISKGELHVTLLFTFEDNYVHVDAKGSNVDGKPIMPLRYIDYLNSRIRKNLVRYNKMK